MAVGLLTDFNAASFVEGSLRGTRFDAGFFSSRLCREEQGKEKSEKRKEESEKRKVKIKNSSLNRSRCTQEVLPAFRQ
jgi:hypothetical protein